MNSRAYQFQLQAAEAAAAAAPVVHAAERGGPEIFTPKAPLLLKIQAAVQGTAADEPAPRQGSGLSPTTMGTIGNATEATATNCKCPECPKWFASEKAMFGHLRKHPERGYKGATRPTTVTASAAAAAAAVAGDKKPKPTKKVPRKETADVPAINMAAAAATKAWAEADLSTKWPASVKRGRTPVVPVQQASGCSEEDEAAMILLELASSSRTSSETQQQRSVEPDRAPDAVVTGHQIQAVVVEEPMLLDHPAAHQIPEAEHQIVHPENALELSAESETRTAVNKQVTDLVITTEAVLIVVPANKPIIPSLDSAGTGDKKAKKQRRVTNPSEQTATTTTTPPPEGAVVVRTPSARRIPSPASDKKHTCPTCGKSFPTHQALGGHMSYHVKGAKITSARNDDLAAVQAMKNILAHRDQQSADNGNSNGNVTIPASAGAGAGAGALLQEHQEAQPPPAQVKAPTPMPQSSVPYVGAGAGALQERQEAQPPPAKVKTPKPKPQATALHVGAGTDALQERQEAQPPPAQVKAPKPKPQAAAPHVGAGADALEERQEPQPPPVQAQAKAKAAVPHVCDACQLIFPSGQALGGHKRKHWSLEKQQAKVASAPAPAPRDFDLNEMPEEGQGENNQP